VPFKVYMMDRILPHDAMHKCSQCCRSVSVCLYVHSSDCPFTDSGYFLTSVIDQVKTDGMTMLQVKTIIINRHKQLNTVIIAEGSITLPAKHY